MKYTISPQSVDFDIPDEWLEVTGAKLFKPNAPAYEASSDDEYPTETMSFSKLQAPIRHPGVTRFVEERMISLIKCILTGKIIPPVEVHLKPGESTYRVKDGYHRFYISAALGYQSLPVSVKPYFDIYEL